MKKHTSILVIIISVIAFLSVGYTIPALMGVPDEPPGGPSLPMAAGEEHPSSPRQTTGDDGYRYLKTLVSFVNIGLFVPLFIIYAGMYREVKSSFTLGLLAVILALGLYAVTSNPLIITTLGGFPGYIGIFQVIPDICATAALCVLVRISLE